MKLAIDPDVIETKKDPHYAYNIKYQCHFFGVSLLYLVHILSSSVLSVKMPTNMAVDVTPCNIFLWNLKHFNNMDLDLISLRRQCSIPHVTTTEKMAMTSYT